MGESWAVMGQRSVELTGGPPWGFRLTTGIKVSRVHPGCCAAELVREGDRIERINGELVTGLTSHQAQVSRAPPVVGCLQSYSGGWSVDRISFLFLLSSRTVLTKG